MDLRPMSQPELLAWYKVELAEAFPQNERKPLEEIQGLIEAGCYDVLGFFNGLTLLGYATMMKRPTADYVLLDYLGVTAARRGGGLGAELLRQLGRRYAHCPGVITEAEAVIPGDSDGENALRLRRIEFYRRCGFAPVYQIGTCGARFQVLLLGKAPSNMDQLMADHRTLYGPLRDDVTVPLAPGETPPLPYWMK